MRQSRLGGTLIALTLVFTIGLAGCASTTPVTPGKIITDGSACAIALYPLIGAAVLDPASILAIIAAHPEIAAACAPFVDDLSVAAAKDAKAKAEKIKADAKSQSLKQKLNKK